MLRTLIVFGIGLVLLGGTSKVQAAEPVELLDHFAGTWKNVVTVKAGGQMSTITDFVSRTWSDDGKGNFLVESGKPQTE